MFGTQEEDPSDQKTAMMSSYDGPGPGLECQEEMFWTYV